MNTCDRREPLRNLLYALEHQSFRDFEVVVVVGPTRDDTVSMLEDEFGERVVVVECPAFNLSVSRNLGLAASRGDLVAFIDDDAVPSNSWLEQVVEEFEGTPALAGVGGRTFNIWTGELQHDRGWISAYAEQQDVFEPRHAAVREGSSVSWFPRLHGCNMVYRRSALLELGGFDESYEYLFDDSDIGIRLGRAGLAVRAIEGAVVYHAPAKGRNRGQADYDINWYCWLKATVYFTLKNGDGPWWRRLRHAIGHIKRFFSEIRIVESHGHLPGPLYTKAKRMLRKGAIEGLWTGLLRRRRTASTPLSATTAPIRPFVDADRGSLPYVTPTTTLDATAPGPSPSRPLRIALLSAEYPPRSQHGIARHTESLARALARLGHEVHVVTLGDAPRSWSVDGTYVHSVPMTPRREYERYRQRGFVDLACWLEYSHAAYDKLEELRRNHGIEVVDSPLWNLDGFVTAIADSLPVSVRIASAMRIISQVHGQAASAENRLLGDLEERFLELASGYVANSRASVQSLAKTYRIQTQDRHLAVVPHGIEPMPEDRIDWLDSRPSDTIWLLFVGRLEGRKGIVDLFDALPQVLRGRPEVRVAIVGADNSSADGFQMRQGCTYPEHFQRQHRDLAERVSFHGHVDDEELQSWYRRCDVFVAPSHYESFGLVYLEAMNHARPVVAGAAGGPLEIVVDGETGFLVEPGQPEDLAKALGRLLDSAELRSRMGRSGRERLVHEYSDRAMALGFVDHYRSLLADRSEELEEKEE